MTEDLSKRFEVVEKQKRVAYALEEAEKTLDINDFRKAVALLNELSEEEKEPLMESFQNVGNILRTYDRQRQSEIETLIGDAKEELDGNKLEEAEKLVNELLDEENKEIYRGMIKEYDEEFIQPKKLHDEIVGLIEEAKDTLDESLLDQARFLIEQVKSTEEQQLLKIEASKAQRFLNGIDEPEMIDEPKINNTDNDKPERKLPVKNDDLENKKYEEAKKLVDTALKTQKGDDINKAIKAVEELKDEKKKKELKDKLNSIKQIKDSNEDKKEPKEVVKSLGLSQITDENELITLINEVLDENPKQIEEYKVQPRLLDYFIGQMMKKTRGKANPALTSKLLKQELDRR